MIQNGGNGRADRGFSPLRFGGKGFIRRQRHCRFVKPKEGKKPVVPRTPFAQSLFGSGIPRLPVIIGNRHAQRCVKEHCRRGGELKFSLALKGGTQEQECEDQQEKSTEKEECPAPAGRERVIFPDKKEKDSRRGCPEKERGSCARKNGV